MGKTGDMSPQLTKHEGWGNDFLVLADADGTSPVSPELAKSLCDRRFGIGADGLLHLGKGADTDLTMSLHNADGSVAEMSGNGLRCLLQAALRLRWATGPEITVATAAGLRTGFVDADADPDASVHRIRVDMGPVRNDGSDGDDMLLNVGNPHRVRRVPNPDSYDLGAAGAEHPDVNLEVIAAGDEDDTVKMRVHERGAGETLACGTGACAVAVAASHWGIVTGPRVTVRQPGGDASVDITDIDHVQLAGPVTFIGTIEVP